MARPLRVEFEGAVYHLCARGNARQPVFRDERDCARFLELLTESAQRLAAAILCFDLMGNHFHLVAQMRRPNLRRRCIGCWSLTRCTSIGGIGRSAICFRAYI